MLTPLKRAQIVHNDAVQMSVRGAQFGDSLDAPLQELRAGRQIPIASVIVMVEGMQEFVRTVSAHGTLTATMVLDETMHPGRTVDPVLVDLEALVEMVRVRVISETRPVGWWGRVKWLFGG